MRNSDSLFGMQSEITSSVFFFSPLHRGFNQQKQQSVGMLYQFIIAGLHAHVLLLITPLYVVVMWSAQGSDVIWLKGISARVPEDISVSINDAAVEFSQR